MGDNKAGGIKETGAGLKAEELTSLAKKMLPLLYTITPQTFLKQMDQFRELPIDSLSKLTLCMELIFEKVNNLGVVNRQALNHFFWIRI